MTRVLTMLIDFSTKIAQSLLILYELIRVKNHKETINSKVRAKEQIFVLDPVK